MRYRLPAPDEERQPAPENYWGGQRELDPGPYPWRQHVLHRHGGQKCGNHQRKHRQGKGGADPESPRHIGQFWIGSFGCDFARLKRHAADGASAWSIPHNLRVHRACVFRAPCRRGDGGGFERHPALGAETGSRLLVLWMHGAGVFPLSRGLCWRLRMDCIRPRLRVLLRRVAKLGGAALATEVDHGAMMFNACRCLRRIDLHTAYWIARFSLLHGAIVARTAYFDLSLSALRAGGNQIDSCVVLAIIRPSIRNREIAGGSPPVWSAMIEIAFMVSLFYSNLLM